MPDAHPTSTAPLTARRTRRATLRPVRLPPRSRPASSRRGARHIRACVPCPPAPASPPRAWFTQCGQHKASRGVGPSALNRRDGGKALASAARSSSSAPSSARANGAISAASPPPAARRARVRSGSRSCSGSKRIEGIKKHAHRQRVLARPARALILACQGRCNGLARARRPARSGSAAAPIAPYCPSPSRRTPPPATSLRASANRGCNVSSSPACTGSGRWKYAPAARSNPTWPEDASTPSADAICASGNRARAASCAISMRGSKASSVDTNAASSFASPPATRCSTAPSPENPAPFPGSDPA